MIDMRTLPTGRPPQSSVGRVSSVPAPTITFATRVIWNNVGQPEDGYLLSIGKEHGLKAGDRVKVTIERIEK